MVFDRNWQWMIENGGEWQGFVVIKSELVNDRELLLVVENGGE